MGFRLKITLRSERRFVVLTSRPVVRWCEACGAESRFVDEDFEASVIGQVVAVDAHRLIIEGRHYICLRSVSDQE